MIKDNAGMIKDNTGMLEYRRSRVLFAGLGMVNG